MTLKYLPSSYMGHLLERDPERVTLSDRQTIEDRLSAFDLQDIQDNNEVVELPIPSEFGSVDEELSEAYLAYSGGWEALETLVVADAPKFPTSFFCPLGWSFWTGKQWQPILTPPGGRCFVLDAETVEVSKGIWHPTCMVAMSTKGWLVWRADLTKVQEVSVVPFSKDNHILGYNVPYDRSYLDTEYCYEDSGNRFYDLMSMWICTNGMSNQQRAVYAKFSKETEDNSEEDGYGKPPWLHKTSTNGLAAAYNFYTEKQLDKGVRDGIVDGGLSWVQDNMPEVIRYCALDVLATHELSKYLLPAYKLHRPSNINRYGAVALGSCWVPLSSERFPSFYERVERVYQENKAELNEMLLEACTAFLERCGETIPADAVSMDWTPAKTGKNKGKPQWYRDVLSTYNSYKNYVDKYGVADKGGLTLSQRYAPTVLEMSWDGARLKWDSIAEGWMTDKHGLIPHPTKRGKSVGSMFLKDFAGLYDTEFITVPEYVRVLVEKRVSAINWVSSRKRISCIRTEAPDGHPVTIPMMSVNGTVTGRATDPIWQVAANPKANRYGTELKSMVAPYPGYSFVGADVNSQEAWLAACHGDEQLGINASTPFSVMVAMGTSANKTDIHSVVSLQTGYTRDVTKSRIYGSLYGQGIKGDSDVIIKANPALSDEQAKTDSGKFLNIFKGNRQYRNGKPEYSNGIASHAFTRMELLADAKQPKTPLTSAYMSKALAGLADYKPTRVNWIVQSSGVDFRDMLVILTISFYKKLGVKGRLVLTIHDELRSMVINTDITKAIYALQLAHLYVRAAFIRAHHLDNIPAGIAWFSSVDVDAYCLRKDPTDPQVTPTQSALPLGYEVTPKQLLEMINK